MTQWKTLKPSMPYGQLPCLTWNGEKICQSMAICRFLAREMNIAGRNSVEMAQVDEIIDAVQDAIDANYKAWYSAKRKEELVMLTGKTFPAALSNLEKRLVERGGQFMVGNNSPGLTYTSSTSALKTSLSLSASKLPQAVQP